MITLTEEDLEDATLDLIVDNNSRNNFGLINQFQQYKGCVIQFFSSEKYWEFKV